MNVTEQKERLQLAATLAVNVVKC